MKIIVLNKKYKQYIKIIINKVMNHWELNYNDAYNQVYKWVNHINNSICYIGIIDKKIIGTAVFDNTNGGVDFVAPAWFTFLWVDKKYRGNGYGWLLTQKRIKYAKQFGYEMVWLDTIQARKYHLKFGWKDVKKIIYKGKIDYIMCYNLNN